MILGVTGGLGCGKSSAAVFFEKRGFTRLDSDAIVRERALTDPGVCAALRARFGDGIFDAKGSVDRSALASRVFVDDAERLFLESITHPVVFAVWREALASAPGANWVVETPLLFEKDLENWFDFTVCVACSSVQQFVRLEQRGLSRELARQRISKQLPLARKIELADFILWNDGSLEFLETQVNCLAGALAQAAHPAP